MFYKQFEFFANWQGRLWGFVNLVLSDDWRFFRNILLIPKHVNLVKLIQLTYFLSEFNRLWLILKVMKFCAWTCKKEWKVMLQQGQHGRLKMKKHAKYSDKKGMPEFWSIFFCCRCGYIMHVSVYEIAEFSALQFGTKIIKISWMYLKLWPVTSRNRNSKF